MTNYRVIIEIQVDTDDPEMARDIIMHKLKTDNFSYEFIDIDENLQ